MLVISCLDKDMNSKIVIKELYSNEKVKEFCTSNKLSEKDVLNNILPLSIYKEAMDICVNCLGKKECLSETENMKVELEYNKGEVSLKYVTCEKANRLSPNNFEVMYYEENEDDVILNDKRSKIFSLMSEYLDSYDNTKLNKGLYIYGECGVGKSFLAYKFAQQLTQKGIKVLYLYYPEFVRQVKSLIGSPEMEKLINKVKTVEVLFIDDLGAENNTAFIRDDILSPILQYRMNSELSLFITSNCNLEQLLEHFSETSNESDKNKAVRIIDRIRLLTKPVELKDENYRLKK